MPGKTLVEKLIFVFISCVAVYFMTFTVYSDLRVSKQRILFYQLQILRMGVNLYQLVNSSRPESLWDINTRVYKLPGDMTDRRYVQGFALDTMGRIQDPFGNPYSYDPITGWVRSVSRGYEFW